MPAPSGAVVSFAAHPISSRLCALVKALPSLSTSMIIRFNADGPIQMMHLPDVAGKLNAWLDCPTPGLAEYQCENCVAWVLPVKTLAQIVAQNSDAWSRLLCFCWTRTACTIKVKCSADSAGNEGDSEDELMNAMPRTDFSTEYTLPVEPVPNPDLLHEFRVSRPRIFLRLGAGIDLGAWCGQVGFAKTLSPWCQLRLRAVENGDMRLEMDSWSSTDNATHYTVRHQSSNVTSECETRQSRCAVQTDALARCVHAIRSILDSAHLVNSGCEAVAAVLEDQAVVFYVQIASDDDGSGGTSLTLFIPAYTA